MITIEEIHNLIALDDDKSITVGYLGSDFRRVSIDTLNKFINELSKEELSKIIVKLIMSNNEMNRQLNNKIDNLASKISDLEYGMVSNK